MNPRLAKTLRILKETPNEAALEVLLWALDEASGELQEAVLVTLLDRRSLAGHFVLLQRWPALPESWKARIAERSSRIEAALRSAILSTDTELHRNACDVAVFLRAYDLIPTLITAAEDKGNPHSEIAADAAAQLCEQLHAELVAPRDYGNRRDPMLVRQYVYAALENAIIRYEQHARSQLVESFLLLAQPDDAVLKRSLLDPKARIFTAILQVLATSNRQAVQRLMLRYLDDSHAPPGVFAVLTRRRDVPFLRLLFQRCSEDLSPAMKANLRRVDSLPWLRDDLDWLTAFSGKEQCGAIHLALATGMNRLRVFELLKWCVRSGDPLCRRAACAALADFKGSDANQLVVAAMDDPDPLVQAQAVAQVRERGIPGIVPRLIELVDSPHEPVREAARGSLQEFTFQRYLSAFELLEPAVRVSTGSLVKRIDPLATEQLVAELTARSRVRRLRGVEVAVALEMVSGVQQHILELAHDEDHFIRAEAARALSHVDTELSRETLRGLLTDRSVSVQEEAAQALARLSGGRPLPPLAPQQALGTAGLEMSAVPTESSEPL